MRPGLAHGGEQPNNPGIPPDYLETLHYAERKHAHNVLSFRAVQSLRARAAGIKGACGANRDMSDGSGSQGRHLAVLARHSDEFPVPPTSVRATCDHSWRGAMALDLFVGIPVTNYAVALPWYERFFGGPPPARRETYGSGPTKVTYRDADGNELSLGGNPA